MSPVVTIFGSIYTRDGFAVHMRLNTDDMIDATQQLKWSRSHNARSNVYCFRRSDTIRVIEFDQPGPPHQIELHRLTFAEGEHSAQVLAYLWKSRLTDAK